MELRVYGRDLMQLGLIEKITSLIWTRRYWAYGAFKLLVPFTEVHAALLVKNHLILKRGDTEMAEIQYVYITQDSQGEEHIEVQGRFITHWVAKRIILNRIVTVATAQAILRRIVSENIISPQVASRRISGIDLASIEGISRPSIQYASEEYANALLECETVARASRLGFGIYTDIREKRHTFRVYDGADLTVDQKNNPPCIFSQEFDNVLEQEYTNSVENLKSTAYVGGENKEGLPRQIVAVGDSVAGLNRDEIFINATDITQTYKDGQQEITMTLQQYIEMLRQRGQTELEKCAETLAFASKVNAHSNLVYKADYDLGDRVTCVNRKWGVRVNVRITEVAEIFHKDKPAEISITFGESLPALIDTIRQLIK